MNFILNNSKHIFMILKSKDFAEGGFKYFLPKMHSCSPTETNQF